METDNGPQKPDMFKGWTQLTRVRKNLLSGEIGNKKQPSPASKQANSTKNEIAESLNQARNSRTKDPHLQFWTCQPIETAYEAMA